MKELPVGWNQYTYSSQTTKVLRIWLKKKLALGVTSTIVGIESNTILNSLFKKFGKVEVVKFIRLPFDEGLKKNKRS